ncbi:MAG TPA: alpha/beta hydrolase [Rariglobus sp.]
MIHVLPGMGADSGLFTGSWRRLPDAVFVDWPAYSGERTLAEIAARVVGEYDIADESVVVGTSLGGMVACEIARLRRLRRLVLIGSALHPDEINPLLLALRPLARIAPVDLLQWSASSVPDELARMFRRADPAFMRAAIAALSTWAGIDPTLPAPLRIHGKNDRVIPPPRHADLLLDGGHLIVVTHAGLCCDFILADLQHDSRPPSPRP